MHTKASAVSSMQFERLQAKRKASTIQKTISPLQEIKREEFSFRFLAGQQRQTVAEMGVPEMAKLEIQDKVVRPAKAHEEYLVKKDGLEKDDPSLNRDYTVVLFKGSDVLEEMSSAVNEKLAEVYNESVRSKLAQAEGGEVLLKNLDESMNVLSKMISENMLSRGVQAQAARNLADWTPMPKAEQAQGSKANTVEF